MPHNCTTKPYKVCTKLSRRICSTECLPCEPPSVRYYNAGKKIHLRRMRHAKQPMWGIEHGTEMTSLGLMGGRLFKYSLSQAPCTGGVSRHRSWARLVKDIRRESEDEQCRAFAACSSRVEVSQRAFQGKRKACRQDIWSRNTQEATARKVLCGGLGNEQIHCCSSLEALQCSTRNAK